MGAKENDNFEERFKYLSNVIERVFDFYHNGNSKEATSAKEAFDFIKDDEEVLRNKNSDIAKKHQQLCKVINESVSKDKQVDNFDTKYLKCLEDIDKVRYDYQNPKQANKQDKKRLLEKGRTAYYNKDYVIASAFSFLINNELQPKFFTVDSMEPMNNKNKNGDNIFCTGESLPFEIIRTILTLKKCKKTVDVPFWISLAFQKLGKKIDDMTLEDFESLLEDENNRKTIEDFIKINNYYFSILTPEQKRQCIFIRHNF